MLLISLKYVSDGLLMKFNGPTKAITGLKQRLGPQMLINTLILIYFYHNIRIITIFRKA